MDKVFVVTVGAYSDYRIVGVFSTREKALEFCPAAGSDRDDARIEEYEFDQLEGGLLQDTFRVWMNMDGAIIATGVEAEFHPARWSDAGHCEYGGGVGTRIYGFSVVSSEHAQKVAAEYRQSLLRQNA